MRFALGTFLQFHAAGPFPGNQPVEIVAVRAVTPESLLIEEALYATAETDLISVLLCPNGPTHVLMPATAQDRDRRSRQPGCHDSQGP